MFSAACAFAAGLRAPSGGGGGTTPSWIAVGTADTTGTASATPAYGSNVAGDLFVMVVAGRLTAFTTPAGWTLQAGPNDQAGRRCYILTRDARSSGGESGSVSVTLTANSMIATIHTFRNVAATAFIEDVTLGGSAANGSTVNGIGVTAGGNNRLAVFAGGSGDEHVWVSMTGESGGDWVQRNTQTTPTGNNCSYALQTAALDSGGTVSGGSISIANVDEHSLAGFALVGT